MFFRKSLPAQLALHRRHDTPFAVLLSAGLLLSDEVVNGVVGHNDYDVVAFGNLDILPAENVAIGVEYKQGVDAGDGIRNHDYWDAHVAWFVTKNLTVVEIGRAHV